jgi:CII-binding regulator of phage lambda lysogenization HflD
VSHLCRYLYFLTQWDTEKFVKKLFGENEVDAVLQRLDRLTQDEARTTAAQTLEVVYGLVQNMRAIMDGKRIDLAGQPLAIEHSFVPQTARHRLIMSGIRLVRLLMPFDGNKFSLYLTQL